MVFLKWVHQRSRKYQGNWQKLGRIKKIDRRSWNDSKSFYQYIRWDLSTVEYYSGDILGKSLIDIRNFVWASEWIKI